MGDFDRTALISGGHHGRSDNKRKRSDYASTAEPFAKLTAASDSIATSSSKGVEPTLQVNSFVAGEVTAVNISSPTTSSDGVGSTQPHDNRLLAGYLAHEFLTKGTLFGEIFDPARAETSPDSNRNESKVEQSTQEEEKKLGYAELTSLFWREGTHIPNIVNPTDLARWIRL